MAGGGGADVAGAGAGAAPTGAALAGAGAGEATAGAGGAGAGGGGSGAGGAGAPAARSRPGGEPEGRGAGRRRSPTQVCGGTRRRRPPPARRRGFARPPPAALAGPLGAAGPTASPSGTGGGAGGWSSLGSSAIAASAAVAPTARRSAPRGLILIGSGRRSRPLNPAGGPGAPLSSAAALALRDYELILILDPEAGDEARDRVAEQAKSTIESKGTLNHEAVWGMRRMAYEIDKRPEGDYRYFRFAGEKDLLDDLDHSLKITDGVLRFRIFKVDPESPVIEPPDTVQIMRRDEDDDRGRGRGPRRPREDDRSEAPRAEGAREPAGA
jgi:small subunit ribosomal protein S6